MIPLSSLLLVMLVPSLAIGQALPRSTPQAAGLTTAGVARLDSAMQAYISSGKLPGIVIAVARDGRVAHWKAFGQRRVETKAPMEPNDLFRIYSMTKPVTSTAAMMLVDAGKLGLVSTATHYLRFAQMILDGGELDGVRLLRRETAAQMIQQLPDALIPIRVGEWALDGTGFGLGFSVVVKPPDAAQGPAGRAGWGGCANTFFWIDPANRLIGLILTQFFPCQAYPIEVEFRRLVYRR